MMRFMGWMLRGVQLVIICVGLVYGGAFLFGYQAEADAVLHAVLRGLF